MRPTSEWQLLRLDKLAADMLCACLGVSLCDLG